MKKFILFAAVLFSAVTLVNAQTSNSGTAKLTVNLHAVQSITVGGEVVIDYTAANDYLNGKESNTSTELSVVSAGGFVIRVQAEDLTDGTSLTNKIEASTIAVTAIAGDNGADATFDTNGTLAKGDTKTPLISSLKGGVDKKYSVSYKGTGANKYMENYNAGDGEIQSYSTTVTYTIAPN